jgi:hypothetical protein
MAEESRAQHPIEEVAAGQRMIILAILVQIGAAILRASVGVETGGFALWLALGVVAIALAITGLMRLSDGLGYSSGRKAVLLILSVIPLASLVMLVMVNARATEALRAAGYRVGLLGARRP